MAGKGFYIDALNGYCNALQRVVNSLMNFGDTAGGIAQGDATGYEFIGAIENSMNRFLIKGDGVFEGFMAYLCSLGIAISLIFFLISMLQLVTEDRFTPEFLVKFFAKFVISFVVILWSKEILTAMIEFGNAFADDAKEIVKKANVSALYGGGVTTDFGSDAISQVLKNHAYHWYTNIERAEVDASNTITKTGGAIKMGIFEAIGPALTMFKDGILLDLFGMATGVLSAIVMFIVLTNDMELYVRGAFLPVAAGLMSDDGWKGAGGRYFRKLMSLATRKAIVITIAAVFGQMAKAAIGSIFMSVFNDEFGLSCNHDNMTALAECNTCLSAMKRPLSLPIARPLLISIVICVAGISMMFKSMSVTDDLWGAR